MKWINRLYIFFLGIILAITTGFGVAAFYPQPVQPTYPLSTYTIPLPGSCSSTPQAQKSIECQDELGRQKQSQDQNNTRLQKYEEDTKNYQNLNAGYTRTAIFFGIVIGAIFALFGIGLIKSSRLVANGLLLAGISTAILTRLLIMLASLGASTSGTSTADSLAYTEFGVLLILSVVVIIVGLSRLKEETTSANT